MLICFISYFMGWGVQNLEKPAYIILKRSLTGECDGDVYVKDITACQTQQLCKLNMRKGIILSDWVSVHIKTLQNKKVGQVNKQTGNL